MSQAKLMSGENDEISTERVNAVASAEIQKEEHDDLVQILDRMIAISRNQRGVSRRTMEYDPPSIVDE